MLNRQLTAKRVLVPVDRLDLSIAATECAALIARATGASITLLHVYEPADTMSGIVPGADEVTDVATERAGALRELKKLAEQARFLDGIALHSSVEVGYTPSSILKYARLNHIDLIVMGTHGRTGLSRWLMGSVAQQVVRQAACPVILVHDPTAASDHGAH